MRSVKLSPELENFNCFPNFWRHFFAHSPHVYLFFSFSCVLTENSSFRRGQGRKERNFSAKNIRVLCHLIASGISAR